MFKKHIKMTRINKFVKKHAERVQTILGLSSVPSIGPASLQCCHRAAIGGSLAKGRRVNVLPCSFLIRQLDIALKAQAHSHLSLQTLCKLHPCIGSDQDLSIWLKVCFGSHSITSFSFVYSLHLAHHK